MKVTVAINNYNYARFLGEAIESALEQSYEDVEVIVVDDGSTDNSREVIEGYAGSVIPVFKENGGQASALNAGFEASSGEAVIFLDADDILLPDTVERVVRAFEANPGATKVQYRMRIADAGGRPSGGLVPAAHLHMPRGDLRSHILRFHSYTRSPISGNAFARRVLEEILPMPESPFHVSADLHLSDLVPMYGPVLSLEEPGGLYRVHGKNQYKSIRSIDLAKLRDAVLRWDRNRCRQKALFASLYGIEVKEVGKWDLLTLREQVAYLRLDPGNYPFKEGRLSLCLRGVAAAAIFPEIQSWYKRVFNALWFAAMLVATRPIAWALTEELLYPSGELLSEKLLGFMHRLPEFTRQPQQGREG